MILSRGILVAGLVAGLLHLLGRVTDGGWLDLASAGVLALPVAALVLRPRLDQVTCTRGRSARGAAGDRVTTVLEVGNTGGRPSAALVVLDELPGHGTVRVAVPALAPGARIRLHTERVALHRTSGPAGTVTLHAWSPFGLVGSRRRLTPTGRAVVHPAPVAVPVLPAGRGAPGGDGARGRPVAGSGTEVLGLRAWRPGEPRTSVSARASARHGRPLVLERERQDERDLVVLVTAGAGAAWEHGLSQAAALAADALHRGRPLVLLGLAGPPPRSAAQVLDAVAAADDAPPLTVPAARAALRSAGTGGTLVLVASSSDELVAVRRAAAGTATRLVVLGGEPVPVLDPPDEPPAEPATGGLSSAAAVAVVATGLFGQAAAALAGVLPAAALAVSAALLPLAAVTAVGCRWRTTTVSAVATVLSVLA